jgi:putative ABC transport system ATP-binding protein
MEISAGARLLIEGPSGRGKTTLLQLMAGLFTPTEGSVFWDDQDIRDLTDEQRAHIRREKFGIVFQTLNLLDHLTALENVMLGVRQDADARGKAQASLEAMGLPEVRDRFATQLSLGEQQRVAVARVLAAKPRVVLADEPTSGLDESNAHAVMDGLLQLSSETTVVTVSHDHRMRPKFATIYDWDELVTA